MMERPRPPLPLSAAQERQARTRELVLALVTHLMPEAGAGVEHWKRWQSHVIALGRVLNGDDA